MSQAGDVDGISDRPTRCDSGLHNPGMERVATWLVDTGDGDTEKPLCSACHFLAKRWGTVVTDRRVPWETMVFEVSAFLSQADLVAAIEDFKEQAARAGFELQVAGFYDIRAIPDEGILRITFRKM